MGRSRIAVLLAAAVALAAAVFAVGAAVSSQEDDPAAEPNSVAVAPATAGAAAGATFDIGIAGFAFAPVDAVDAVVQVGTTVTWTNSDGFDHTVLADGDAFPESPTMGEGGTYSLTFTEPGTFTYKCGIHPQMKGTIVVEA